MIEHESSYIFSYESFPDFEKDCGLKTKELGEITDSYLSKGIRVRHFNNTYTLTKKSGDKKDGYRLEEECKLEEDAAKILISQNKMTIKKTRYEVLNLNPSFNKFQVTVDYITEPMTLIILEVEAIDETGYPIPLDITNKMFAHNLIKCPLGSWDLFKRKIAFCGGPCSGKTETAKWLSYMLNTKFGANSFHTTEYATSFIQKYNRLPKFEDQIFILHGQWRRERNAHMHDIIISDCPTFLSYVYAQLAYRKEFSSDVAFQLSKIYKQSLFDVESYSDIIFLRLKDYKENGVRYQNKEEALQIQRRIEEFLQDHRISHQVRDYEDSEMILSNLFYMN